MSEPEVLDAPIETTAIVRQPERSAVLLMPVMNVQTAMARLKEFQEFCASYLQESRDGGNDGGDYGIIPGTKKKTLLKSGADKLCEIYGLYDEYVILRTVENWESGLFDYSLTCLLKSRRDDSVVGSGVGSCSSYESKYRWRESQRLCPACQQPAIIKGKQEYGCGWVCFKKKGGCGAKFGDGALEIESQSTGRSENPDIADSKNTVLKMAKKRAKMIGVTRSSGIFTQDMEDVAHAAPPMPTDDTLRTPAQAVESAPVGTSETHAEKIQRIKREAAANRKPEPITASDIPFALMLAVTLVGLFA
jgi:hypothetical protein